jgi:hypothetical protein
MLLLVIFSGILVVGPLVTISALLFDSRRPRDTARE